MTTSKPPLPYESVIVRAEAPEDASAISSIHKAAFARDIEARLVDRLRRQEPSYMGLMAEVEGKPVGHVAFSAVTVDPADALEVQLAGLGPMAVLPDHQQRGVGRALVAAGLDACREAGYGGVVVLGHSSYYPRFGFHRASRFGLCADFDVPEEAFMALPLAEADIRTSAKGGVVRYPEAFHDL